MKRFLRMLPMLALAATCAHSVNAQTALVGITEDNRVFRIANAVAPGTTTTPVAVSGIVAGQVIAGADYRPNTGELYILGYNSATTTAQLYTLNATTGVATAVGASSTLLLGTGSIGFDFNPTVDRIRVVGANAKNYRLHPTTGAIAATDADLNFATGDINAGQTPTIGAVAYTNSYIGSEATQLFDYDETRNILALQNPPNNGTLNTIGLSGIVVNPVNRTIDMDVAFDAANSTNTAYLVANTTGTTDALYTISTATGAATLVGTIGGGLAVKNIAVEINRSVPATVTGRLVYALTRTNRNLISFDSDAPATIRSTTAITGVTAGQSVVGMDFRPATRTLYALGYAAVGNTYQVYSVDPATGVATAVNATSGTLALDSSQVGFDFNPTVDRIRVTGANGSNYRLNPNDGAIAATDSMLRYNIGDVNENTPARIGSVAYTNSYAGATTTTLYGIDDSTGRLVTINPPNNGRLNTLISNVITLNQADRTTDLDFYYDSTSMSNIGYLVANSAGTNNDSLYTLNATSGTITGRQRIGGGIPVIDIAVMPTYRGPLSIRNIAATLAVNVYPNPAGNVITVAQANGKNTLQTIMITDIAGRTVRNVAAAKTGVTTINVETLTPGIYMLTAADANGAVGTARIVKD